MPRYRAYGLGLESPVDLPSVREDPAAPPDVVIAPGDQQRFEAARASIPPAVAGDDWFRSGVLDDGAIYLRWTGLFEFLVSKDGRRIDYLGADTAALDSFVAYLLGQVLSFSLIARGIEALHATVVAVDGRAVGFVGDCGSGKSTLAAAMLSRGFPLVTDDLMVLAPAGRHWTVQPGIPRIKLFPSVARRVLGRQGIGTPMNRGTSKLVLPLDGPQATTSEFPLDAIYAIDSARARRPRGPAVQSLHGSRALIEVVRAAFNLIVTDRDRVANQFAFATRVSSSVPIRRLTYPRTLSTLPEVCDVVLSDLAACAPSAMNA